MFHDPDQHPFHSPLDRMLYVLREVDELKWIADGLFHNPPTGLDEKLKLVVGGSDFAIFDEKSTSRDTQFELRIASYFCRTDFNVDVSGPADVVASRWRKQFAIECKRISSRDKLLPRLKAAARQLARHQTRPRLGIHRYGVVATEVTAAVIASNGISLAATNRASREGLQEKLVDIYGSVQDDQPVFADARNIFIWLQLHIPMLLLQPVIHGTRFSSYLVEGPLPNARHRRAAMHFSRAIEEATQAREISPG